MGGDSRRRSTSRVTGNFLTKLLIGASSRWWPVVRHFRLLGIARLLARLGLSHHAVRKIGPMTLGFDIRDRYQVAMSAGVYEEFATAMMRMALRPGDTYVDVGAQMGYTAAIAAELIGSTGRMILIEPDPVALEKLEAHLATGYQAGGMPKTEVVRAACSRKSGTLRFHVSPILGHSRILKEGEANDGGRTIEVPIRSADDILRELVVDSVHFLKIDAEGHEIDVLAGLQKYLSNRRIAMLLVEKNFHLFDDPARDTLIMHSLVGVHGYTGIHDTGPKWITTDSLSSVEVDIENLIYADCPSKFEPLGLVWEGSPPLDHKAMREFAELGMNYGSELEARRLVEMAGSGGVAEAIAKGEELLKACLDIHWFRGHLAWWYQSVSDHTAAMRHYGD